MKKQDQQTISGVARSLKRLRERAGLSLNEMARRLGFERASSYQHYETRYKREFLPVDLALKIGAILQTCGLQKSEISQILPAEINIKTVELRSVPLISWVEAGLMTDVVDPYPAGAAADYIQVDSDSQTLIGLRVSGSSMDRIAPEGSVIIVDYADKTLVDGKFYVVRQGVSMATFKRYRASPPRLEPHSTDRSHQSITPGEDTEIVGRVIKVITDL